MGKERGVSLTLLRHDWVLEKRSRHVFETLLFWYSVDGVWDKKERWTARRDGFICRMPGKSESGHDTCIAGFLAGGSARHRYIAGIFLGGLAHVLTSDKFSRREEEDIKPDVLSFSFWKGRSGCEERRYIRRRRDFHASHAQQGRESP